MTKTFYFCPDDYRTLHELREALTQLMRQIIYSAESAVVQRIWLSNREPISMCCGENEMVVRVEYGVEQPERIAFHSDYRSFNSVAKVIALEFPRWGIDELVRLQVARSRVPYDLAKPDGGLTPK